MTGVIDVGGGLRGIYGAGVFDRCLDENIRFDCCIGVSAGGANVASFLAKQKGRNYLFYHDYAFRKEYMSLSNYLKTGSYIGLDYIYGTITEAGGENPLDVETLMKYDGIYNIVATNAENGEAVYFDKTDFVLPYDRRMLSASCCIPFACKPVEIEGRKFFDGGIADPVPFDRAFSLGCDKVVLILTRPVDFIKNGKLDSKGAKVMSQKFPGVSEKLKKRAKAYNEAVQRAKELEKQGKCLIIAPDDCCGIGTLKKTPEGIDRLYRKGYDDGGKIKEFIK